MDRKIKKLPELIIHKKQGLEYKLIERIGNVAWYEVRCDQDPGEKGREASFG